MMDEVLLGVSGPAGSDGRRFIRWSTMCVCGDNQEVVYAGGNVFAPHTDRRTGEPCMGVPLPGWPTEGAGDG